MTIYKTAALIILLSVLSSCASNSGIIPLGKDSFIVTRQAASGFHGMGTLKADAVAEATEFCQNLNKEFQIIGTKEAEPPYILGNFPQAEVQFMCLSEGDRELTRPKLRADTGVLDVNHKVLVKNDDMFTQLRKLKELLDEGILTESEYKAEKHKVLNEK